MSNHTKMLIDLATSGADAALIVQVATTIIVNLELNIAIEHGKAEHSHALDKNWTLPDQGRAYAISIGWSEDRVANEEEKFRNYNIARGIRRKDWLAAWRNWCRSPYQAKNVVDDGDLSVAERKFLQQEKTANAIKQLHLFAHQGDKGNGRGNG